MLPLIVTRMVALPDGDDERDRNAPGVKRFDLALGDESYKAEWCDEHILLETSTLAFTARGRLLQKMIRLRAAARSRKATDPRLYERAKWLKGMARKFRLPF
jgi:CelD/BcsL family acetyltransferase involved in cellulose biosynthesis